MQFYPQIAFVHAREILDSRGNRSCVDVEGSFQRQINDFEYFDAVCIPRALGLLRACERVSFGYKILDFRERSFAFILLYFYYSLPVFSFNGRIKNQGQKSC